MSFDALKKVLIAVENQPGWEAQRHFRRVREIWYEVVEKKYIPHTRPIYISRQVLWVATSSSVWSQNLTLKRYGLLKKLNGRLVDSLEDLRFSPAQWHENRLPQKTTVSTSTNITKSSKVSTGNAELIIEKNCDLNLDLQNRNSDPQIAWQSLKTSLRQSSQTFPHCPQCDSPTPPKELQNWGICALCATHQWRR